MNDQTILLIFLILGTIATLFLYIWKAKKEMEYKGDERWKLVQIKANNIANLSHYLLIIVVVVIDIVIMMSDLSMTITLNRLITYVILFVSLRNCLELGGLFYFDQKL